MSKRADYYALRVKGWSDARIAKQHGIREDSVRRMLSDYTPPAPAPNVRSIQDAPQLSSVVHDKALVIETDNAVLTADWELTDTNRFMWYAPLAVGNLWGINHKIYLGDLLRSDQRGVSSHLKTTPENVPPFEHDLRELRRLVSTYAQVYDKQYAIYGNHDDMVARRSDGQFTLWMALQDLPIQTSYYRYMWIKTTRGYIYLAHPTNTSRPNPANVASTIYNKLIDPEGGKDIVAVVTAHQHRKGIKHSEDGRCLCVSIPAMRDKLLTSYVAQGSNKFPEWQQGFIVLRDGILNVLTLDSIDTDWRYWLGKYHDKLQATRLNKGKGKTA